MQRSPHAYTPSENITSAKLLYSLSPEGGASENAKIKYYNQIDHLGNPYFTGLNAPEDLFVDELNHVYIVNTGNNQVVVTDENYNIRLIISTFVNHYGVVDSFKNPNGVFVTKDEIYVADTEKKRIVIFDK